jgi:hypothetical protein
MKSDLNTKKTELQWQRTIDQFRRASNSGLAITH